jgi:hypothetical protein
MDNHEGFVKLIYEEFQKSKDITDKALLHALKESYTGIYIPAYFMDTYYSLGIFTRAVSQLYDTEEKIEK